MLSGIVKQVGNAAGPVLVEIAHAGRVIGIESLFESGSHSFTAVALTSCKLARLNGQRFMEIMFASDIRNMRRNLSLTVGPWLQTFERHPILVAGSARERLRVALLQLAKDFGTPDQRGVILNLPVTHTMLAEMIGAARQTVSRMVTDMARKGVLFRDRRRLIVVVQALCKFGNAEERTSGRTLLGRAGGASDYAAR